MMNIRAIIFDYGGTIDTASTHWSEVLWEAFQASGIDVTKEQFREAYVHGERTLAREPLIKPQHTMLDLLRIKADIELSYLQEKGWWQPAAPAASAPFAASASSAGSAASSAGSAAPSAGRVSGGFPAETPSPAASAVARYCYDYVLRVLDVSGPVISHLADRYPLCLVSNFYGNIQAILTDFGLRNYFSHIIESAVVGVRKPDPRIFQLGVTALGIPAKDVVVIGDSYSKDILPARAAGCQTIWYRGIGWGDEQVDESVPTAIIDDFRQLDTLLQ